MKFSLVTNATPKKISQPFNILYFTNWNNFLFS